MAASRYIMISAHPQGEALSFPCEENKIRLTTVQTVYTKATGLKHFRNSLWEAVPVDNGFFQLPVGVNNYSTVSGNIGQARQILSGSLASRVATAFKPTGKITPSSTRSTKKFKGKPKNLSRSFRVVFIKAAHLPVRLNRSLVVLEGMVDISSSDEELTIKENLKKIIDNSGETYEEIKILTYNAKELSLPLCVPGFCWNGQQIKALVGQGKLYIMMDGYKEKDGSLDDSSSTESLPEIGLLDRQIDGVTEDKAGEHALRTELENDGSAVTDQTNNTSQERRNTVSERNEVTALVSTDAGNNFRSTSPDLPDLTTSTGAGLCNTTLPANTPGFSEASTSAADRTQFIASSGTPEVTFHPRLSLRHRSREMSRSLPRFQREVIEVVDTEDEELERAIQASLLDHVPVQMQVTESKTLNEVLTQLYDRWVSDSRQTIIVSRKTVLESAFRALERITFKLNGKMFVKFSGEIGEDYGGPRREFFRLALDELQGSHIFCGTESKYFNHDVDLLEKGRFRLAGKLIALSFIHDGPSPHFMDPTVFDLMLKGTADMKNFNAVTLPADVQAILKQLTDVDTIDAGNNFIHTNGDWLIENGFNNIWGFSPEDKDTVYNQIIKQIVYYRCSAEINEFTLGMNDVGEFWNTVKNYPDMFKSEFCGQTVQLTRESFEALCKLDLSEEGSNSRLKENDTVYGWELFLQDIDEQCVEVTFAELLSFITGTDRIPPRGFQKKIDIHFFTSEHGTQRLPSVSTCALELNLPRGITDPEEFKAIMIRSLKESQGFHKI